MSKIRMLCEQYIRIDDELNNISKSIDKASNTHERTQYVAEYVGKFIEKEDFKSGMRRHLISELINGVSDR